LKDWNLRVLLKEVSVSEGTSWAILRDPSAFETTLWQKRNVKIYNLALERFVAEMQSNLDH
jgi:hypothetical protein